MKLKYFLLTFLLFFIKSCPEYRRGSYYIKKNVTHCLIGGILNENEFKKELSSCNIYPNIKEQILKNLQKEKNEFDFENFDKKKRIIYYNYAKINFNEDKKLYSFFIYSYSITVVKTARLFNCRRFHFMKRCGYAGIVDLNIEKEDIKKWENQTLKNLLANIKLKFPNYVDEKIIEKFYSDFPYFKK